MDPVKKIKMNAITLNDDDNSYTLQQDYKSYNLGYKVIGYIMYKCILMIMFSITNYYKDDVII